MRCESIEAVKSIQNREGASVCAKKHYGNCVSVGAAFSVLNFAGCAKPAEKNAAGKAYTREGEGFGRDFYIKLNNGGTFKYYEDALNGHIGIGERTIENSVLTLADADWYVTASKLRAAALFSSRRVRRVLFIQN